MVRKVLVALTLFICIFNPIDAKALQLEGYEGHSPVELARRFPRMTFHDPAWFEHRYILNENIQNNNFDLEDNFNEIRNADFTIVNFLTKEPDPELYQRLYVWLSEDKTDHSENPVSIIEGMGLAYQYATSGGKKFTNNGEWPGLANGNGWYYADNGTNNLYPGGGRDKGDYNAANKVFFAEPGIHDVSDSDDPFLELYFLGSFQHYAPAGNYWLEIELSNGVTLAEANANPANILIGAKLGEGVPEPPDPNNANEFCYTPNSVLEYSEYIIENYSPGRDDVDWADAVNVSFANLRDGDYTKTGESHLSVNGFRSEFVGPFELDGGFNNPIAVKIWWNGTDDISIRSIRFFSEFYYALMVKENPDSLSHLASDLRNHYRGDGTRSPSNYVTGWHIDEPAFYMGDAYKRVLDISRDNVSFHGNRPVGINGASGGTVGPLGLNTRGLTWNNLEIRLGKRIAGYVLSDESFGLDTLIYDRYVLKPDIVQESPPTVAYANSLQSAFDKLIHTSAAEYSTQNNMGLLGAATAAHRAQDAPWWCTVQAQQELRWNSTTAQWYEAFRDPTPAEIKAQCYLALCYGAKGLQYYLVPSTYDWALKIKKGIPGPTVAPNPATFGPGMADNRGLFDLRDPTNNYYDEQSDFVILGDPNQYGPAFTQGHLEPNDKYYAVQDVNQHLDNIGMTLIDLVWEDAACGATGNYPDMRQGDLFWDDGPVLELLEVEDAVTHVNDALANGFVEMGIFHHIRDESYERDVLYFMLVNRRCTGNARNVTVGFYPEDGGNLWTVIELDDDLESQEHDAMVEVTTTLEPGEGKLFMAYCSDYLVGGGLASVWDGLKIIDEALVISTSDSVQVEPGTHVMFVDGGSLTVYGKIKALGTMSSFIYFDGLDSENDGTIRLYGVNDDEFEYCVFRNMTSGIVSSKYSGSLEINESSFIGCYSEGLKVTSGTADVSETYFGRNGTDGAYLYNCLADLDGCVFTENEDNGLYAYSVNSNTQITECEFIGNHSDGNGTIPNAGLRLYSCSPTLSKNTFTTNEEYGIYGANGSYPSMSLGTSNAANTITENASHETCWNSAYPSLAFGHNNFYVEDGTLINISGVSLSSFNVKGNYWGGGAPYLGSPDPCYSYVGPGSLLYYPYDTSVQTRVHGDDGLVDLRTKEGADNGISDGEEEREANAFQAFVAAVELEEESPARAIAAHRALIEDYTETSYAPISIDHLLWIVRQSYAGQERDNELDMLDNYFANVADTTQFATLAWKAYRASLWALAAQHRYEDAIAGFEAIVQDADCLADSVFAVIDAGTLHLEAQEWAERNDPNRGDAISYGTMHQLCPVDYPTHRKHVDDLLSLLNGGNAYATKAIVPQEFFLAQNYPNPFNDMTRIQYGLPMDSKVQIRIYDITGREVATLVNAEMKAGSYTVPWMSRNNYGAPVSSGVYFCRIQAGDYVKTTKMTLLK